MSRVSGDFPVQFATRLPNWPAGGLLRCSAVRLSVCRVSFFKVHEHGTYDLSRGQVASILVRHARFPRDTLATYLPGCHEDATRKLLLSNFSFTGCSSAIASSAPRRCRPAYTPPPSGIRIVS